jgi:hypothetical protein
MTVYVVLGVIVLATQSVALTSRIKRVRRAWYVLRTGVSIETELRAEKGFVSTWAIDNNRPGNPEGRSPCECSQDASGAPS